MRFPKAGLLELTSSEIVRVTLVKSGEIVLEVPLAQVRRLRIYRGTLMRLRVNSQLHWIDVDTAKLKQPTNSHMKGPAPWIQHLRANNIPVNNIRFIDFVIISVVLCVLFLLIPRLIIWLT